VKARGLVLRTLLQKLGIAGAPLAIRCRKGLRGSGQGHLHLLVYAATLNSHRHGKVVAACGINDPSRGYLGL
jgi:hypothetical protein